MALFALRHQGGEDAVNVIVEFLGVESSMVGIEVFQISMNLNDEFEFVLLFSISRCILFLLLFRLRLCSSRGKELNFFASLLLYFTEPKPENALKY